MKKEILMGDEAVAMGAIHAGIKSACGYPGTPSTEIFEYIMRYVETQKASIHALWSSNEKVAYEEALGASYAGGRSIVTMKHVGLNVAADPFMNSAITGVNGGLVVAVADDPGMHSSQNEQDSRYYSHFACILCMEPHDQQEAYDMTRDAYILSERFEIPVMIRLVTRLAHSRSSVTTKEPLPQVLLPVSDKRSQWVLLPINARKRYSRLLSVQKEMIAYSEASPYNHLEIKENSRLGVIASGIAYNYIMEYCQEKGEELSVLKIGTYPLPVVKIQKLFESVERVVVLEDGYPFIEEKLLGILPHSYKIQGRLDGTLPRDGELTPELVRLAFGEKPKEHEKKPDLPIPARPPALCKGCPHGDLYNALNDAMKIYDGGRVFSDIGCYTLGALPPYNAITTCVDMGASISMAKGACDCGVFPSIAVIGDSTFAHSGITPLLGAVKENSNIKVIILDNATVAMTGGQETMCTGDRMDKLILGLGVDPNHYRILSPVPKNLQENIDVILEEINYKGLSILICRRECLQTAKKKLKSKSEKE
ncbi:MAG: indolepyruvate ferredoxin oxidoreductase [Candidatus Brocadiae bacterium]|nr:indolepyruvate ferredoxin oxidoreductase [Candidatus Brocadiia bacterium]